MTTSRRTGPWPEPEAPNAVWTADHKGWFRTRDGMRCEPLTVMDAKSRYALGLEAMGSTAEAEAWPVFERLFHDYGLPERLRSDNGPPFAGPGVTGLTPLADRQSRAATGPRSRAATARSRRLPRYRAPVSSWFLPALSIRVFGDVDSCGAASASWRGAARWRSASFPCERFLLFCRPGRSECRRP